VGVQPFGGHGLSGTGPKAGGPLYLRRLLARCPVATGLPACPPPPAAVAWLAWLAAWNPAAVERLGALPRATLAGATMELPGPVGERNLYALAPRGNVLCLGGARPEAMLDQVGAALLAGNVALLGVDVAWPEALPASLATWVRRAAPGEAETATAVLAGGDAARLRQIQAALASRPGPIIPLVTPDSAGAYAPDLLMLERCTSTNLAAAGGNASLMMLG
jgi:RHH-type proline utilization regulon transcriptional repressor/proline dehydrogenase/delta 1-pyrroline-5-carboxylate dehydrogenase